MKAEYRPGKKGGTVILSDLLVPEGPWSIAIQRESDQKFFTSADQRHWLNEETFSPAEGRALADGNLSFTVSPDLAASFNPRDAYIIWLKGANGEKEQAPMPKPMSGSNANKRASRLDKDPKTSTLELREGEAEQSAAARRKKLMRQGTIALLVLGCLAWFWFDPRGPEDYGFPPPPPVSQDPGAMQESLTPAGAVKRAALLANGTSEEQETAYNLYRFAAVNKEEAAYMPYAACLDPSLPPCGKADKDAVEAWSYYREGPDKQAAATAMTHLLSWLEHQSRAGNQQAAEWLEEIEGNE